jgi:glycosyltransferase involved in cell wall biosynthesis
MTVTTVLNTVNLHIYPSPITHESRMLKETKSIADANLMDQIYLIGMWKEGLEEHEQIDAKRQIWRVKPRLGSQESHLIIKGLRYIEWQLGILWHFRNFSVKCVNCHSLPVLPLGVLFKLLRKTLLVYDTHELETEGAGLVGIKRLLYKSLEAALVRYADLVIVVNKSIGEWYKKRYNLRKVVSVRNIPHKTNFEQVSPNHPLRSKFGINENEILYIFQGNFGPGRGMGMLLDVFSKVEASKHIVFMGLGEWENAIQEYERKCSNIHLHEAVSPQILAQYTQDADIGLCIQENVGLNYFLSLPNKFFEYIMSGVPPIASNFPELKQIIHESDAGWVVDVDQEKLLSLVKEITQAEIQQKREKVLQYRQTIGWQIEEEKLINAYHSLFGSV